MCVHRYRSLAEIKQWQESDDPVARFRRYMEAKGWWTAQEDLQLRDAERMAVLRVRGSRIEKEKNACMRE